MNLSMQDQVLIENKLLPAILTFYELPDREKAEIFVREFFAKYCEERNLDRKAVYSFLQQRIKGMSEFNKNISPKLADELGSIVLTEKERGKARNPRTPKAKRKNADDAR